MDLARAELVGRYGRPLASEQGANADGAILRPSNPCYPPVVIYARCPSCGNVDIPPETGCGERSLSPIAGNMGYIEEEVVATIKVSSLKEYEGEHFDWQRPIATQPAPHHSG